MRCRWTKKEVICIEFDMSQWNFTNTTEERRRLLSIINKFFLNLFFHNKR